MARTIIGDVNMTIELKISKNQVAYEHAMNFMETRVTEIAAGNAEEMLWLLEHPALYTKGTSAKSEDLIEPGKFPVYETGRGGEYTYHGPGVRIAYLMLNLKVRGQMDVKLYVQNLEIWVINSLKHFGIEAFTVPGLVGVWVNDVKNPGKIAKIAAIGIRVKKWVTYHGIAINHRPNLKDFSGIVPCGIKEHGVTSLQEQGIEVSGEELDNVLWQELRNLTA